MLPAVRRSAANRRTRRPRSPGPAAPDTQIRRYEAGTSAPTLDVLRHIAIGLSVTIDSLVFDEHERGPQDDLALAFEATRHLTPEEQATVRELIEAMLLKHEARRWAS